MAKPRRQKSGDESKPDGGGGGGGGASVLHQKLCLSIDMEKQRIHGYTELKVLLEECETIMLHANNMEIRKILVDEQPAEFEYSPFQNHMDNENWSSVSCSKSAADAACLAYVSSLKNETNPNLIISFEKSVKIGSEQDEVKIGSEQHDVKIGSEQDEAKIGSEQDETKIGSELNELKIDSEQDEMKVESEQHEKENGVVFQNTEEKTANGHIYTPEEKVHNIKLVHIDYMLERAEAAILFMGGVLHTNSQIRRARCWFPCMDIPTQSCPFDLEFTVGTDYVAVSSGDLLYQVLCKGDPPRKTYVYKLTNPVSARWISLVVGPFEILPDNDVSSVSHMCLAPNLSKLRNTVGFFHNAFTYYENYLQASFPFGSYKQIFLPPEMLVSSASLGASICMFSSDELYDEKVLDQIIGTRIKLAFSLAKQWFGVYVVAEEESDEWLLDGLAGYLTDSFIKRFLGNNEARYSRYKANSVVCTVDTGGATALNSSEASNNLYGTETIGLYGKVRSWKAVAVLQMLDRQMGHDSFQKVLQTIVERALDPSRSGRTLSTKEFRHLANKIGNLERPFLKEFFLRWIESSGCPVMRMGLSYNKRRNMIELAVIRGCTSNPGPHSHAGWPGMMTIRVHEHDGMYEHPVLPMAGEPWQLVEIQCHSKLAAKRFQKSKKGSKGEDLDEMDNQMQDNRSSMDSPLLWIRADPEMEYLAEIHLHQPVQMWINQLEKDKDVIAQSRAVSVLEKVPQLTSSVINALNNFLNDSKAFWRVRVEAAYALALTTSEENDLAGLHHLLKFYKSRRFHEDVAFPRPNDFHDFPEYFILEAIPHAVALVRTSDKKSPTEAIEFILQLLKYNDNTGNLYSDVYWLSAMIEAVGELEFGHQSEQWLSSLLKRIDRLMQYDSLMPGYSGTLTKSCIRTLSRFAIKMSSSLSFDRVRGLIAQFRNNTKPWKVRVEASRVLLDLEFHFKGLDAALQLFLKYTEEERSLRGETKLAVHAMRLCQANVHDGDNNQISCATLVKLLNLFASRKAFNNVFLRHHLFCIMQIAAGRPPTLYGVSNAQVSATDAKDACSDLQAKPEQLVLKITRPPELHNGPAEPSVEGGASLPILGPSKDADFGPVYADRYKGRMDRMDSLVLKIRRPQQDAPPVPEHSKDAAASNGSERKSHILKIRVPNHSHGGRNENEPGPASSMSVDAPGRGAVEVLHAGNHHNLEEVNSLYDRESRMSASVGSAKLAPKDEDSKDLQCTADSRPDASSKGVSGRPSSDRRDGGNRSVDTSAPSTSYDVGNLTLVTKEKREENKRKRDNRSSDKKDDPEYAERKRLKKEKKKREKEMAKIKMDGASVDPESAAPSESVPAAKTEPGQDPPGFEIREPEKAPEPEAKPASALAPKLRIKIKTRSIADI